MEKLKQKKLAQLHSVFRRYQDIVSATGMTVNSKSLFPHYHSQKHALEYADVFLSVAAYGSYFSAMMSTAVDDKEAVTEYFCTRCPSDWSKAKKTMKASKNAIQLWNDNLNRQNVVLMTISDEMFALMNFGHTHSSVTDENKEEVREIQGLINRYNLTLAVIVVEEIKMLKLACAAENRDSESYEEAKRSMVDMHKDLFPAGPAPTRIDHRQRIDDDRDRNDRRRERDYPDRDRDRSPDRSRDRERNRDRDRSRDRDRNFDDRE